MARRLLFALLTTAVVSMAFLAAAEVLAAEGVLVVHAADLGEAPLRGVRLGVLGSGDQQLTGSDGTARLRLSPGIRPGSVVTLQTIPSGSESWVFLSSRHERVIVPVFDGPGPAIVFITLVRRGDRDLLRSPRVGREIAEEALRQAGIPRPGEGIPPQVRRQVLEEQAARLGLTPAEVEQAIADWARSSTDPHEKGIAAYLRQDYGEAVRELSAASTETAERLEEAMAEHAESLLLLGMAQIGKGLFEDATSTLRQSIRLRQSVGQAVGKAMQGASLALAYNALGVALSERGDASGSLATHFKALSAQLAEVAQDRETLSSAYHGIGVGQAELGRCDLAELAFEEAIRLSRLGDAEGVKDPASLAASLHWSGLCLVEQGRDLEAVARFEEAVTQRRRGDLQGRVDHAALGESLWELGWVYRRQGNFEAMLARFDEAAEAQLQGDSAGRVDRQAIGERFWTLGRDLAEQGERTQTLALRFLKKAADYQLRGDRYDRVDHDAVASTYREIGRLHLGAERYAAALEVSEKAVIAARKGDAFGRVDGENLGAALHEVGVALTWLDRHGEALPYFRQAAASSRRGDLQGRVDGDSVASSLEALGNSLEAVDRPGEALEALSEALDSRRAAVESGEGDPNALVEALGETARLCRLLGQEERALALEAEARSRKSS